VAGRIAGNLAPPWRVPLLALGFASLLLGMWAGLARLGWPAPPSIEGLAAMHGPLMVSGFFGTVISLERAVALAQRWAYAGPLAAGLGGIAAMLGSPAGPALSVVGSVVLLVATGLVYRRQRELFMLTLTLGAACWTIGSLMWWAGRSVYEVVPWWIVFFVLTIGGERLELSRFLPPSPRARRVFAALLAALLGGVAASTFAWSAGTLLLGAALLGLAVWLVRQDIARRTVKASGLTRFIAVCLVSGYAWLAIAGVSILASGGLDFGGAAYDAALHAVLLGFVFSMVFGHAPIIIPAVLRAEVPYHPYFYVPLALLHASLLARLAGDIALSPAWRAWGGALNGLALAAFVLGTIAAVVRGRLAARSAA